MTLCSPFRTAAVIIPELGSDCILSNPFQFIRHHSYYFVCGCMLMYVCMFIVLRRLVRIRLSVLEYYVNCLSFQCRYCCMNVSYKIMSGYLKLVQ